MLDAVPSTNDNQEFSREFPQDVPQNLSSDPMNEARIENATKKHYLWIITPVIVLVLIIIFLIYRTPIIDAFKGIGYNPTPDMLSVRNSLQLTSEGTRIFNATRPLLASRDDFNMSCESHDEAVSVLGCYTNDRIYVYNVDDPSLLGIRESTAAHEFLHAVWTRLTGVGKSELVPTLEKVYSTHSEELKETIESYPTEEQIGEIYVRSATQIADLPEILEAHYAKYFTDQDSIAAFYTSYIAPFNELKKQINELKSELESIEKEIDQKTAALEERASKFDSAVGEFNACANKQGCFTSSYTFYTRRAELVAEQQAINAENDAINALINKYNTKADVYNSSIVRSSELQSIINSNSPTAEIGDE